VGVYGGRNGLGGGLMVVLVLGAANDGHHSSWSWIRSMGFDFVWRGLENRTEIP